MNKRQQLRKRIYNKYGGKCAYCGNILLSPAGKHMHIDELYPVVRNYKWNKDKTRYIHDGTYMNPENLNERNQMPSCPSCNINKHSMSLENFRHLIENFIVSLNRDSTQYKIAKRYGLITENIKPVIFYFELTKE